MSTVLRLITNRIPEWQEDALCQQMDPDTFYPEKGSHAEGLAKSICSRCDVREQCLSWALETGETWGVWGGKTEKERRELTRKAAA